MSHTASACQVHRHRSTTYLRNTNLISLAPDTFTFSHQISPTSQPRIPFYSSRGLASFPARPLLSCTVPLVAFHGTQETKIIPSHTRRNKRHEVDIDQTLPTLLIRLKLKSSTCVIRALVPPPRGNPPCHHLTPTPRGTLHYHHEMLSNAETVLLGSCDESSGALLH